MTLPPPVVPRLADDGETTSLLDWLRVVADQNVPETLQQAAVPVAWMGRTSTDDAQDPTLSLPRQLENSRNALPPGFVIVAKFYDVESGRNTVERRGTGTAHRQFDIPIPRDGGIADLLAEAKRPDRRFVAVVCESIERVARTTYFSTKIEYDLEQSGVALLAADEGIDPAAVPGAHESAAPFRKATPTLTRRIKQAISEWYVLNMLELSWGGTKAHTNQGFNIGKPPYGYLASRTRHPVKLKAEQGKVKHRLVPDPVRGPVVTQIFLWRALDRLGYQAIADRLNLDPDRYPPPDPILGQGRRRVGAWTASNVREILDNPKHTGYMVWNRRKRPRPERDIRGRVNPSSAWVWSAVPTHEPLVTREIFEAASAVARFRKGSRSGTGRQAKSRRTYLLRSYLRCDLCDRRTWGHTVKTNTYYRCSPDSKHHAHQQWYATHPAHVVVREDVIMEPLARFFQRRVFGDGRDHLLARSINERTGSDGDAARAAALTAEIAGLQQRQDNLVRELESFEPSGDDDFDRAWRSGLQARFRAILAEQRQKKEHQADLARQSRTRPVADLSLLEMIPQAHTDLGRLPEDRQRRVYDAFHLELRYNDLSGELDIRVTITGDTATELAATVKAATEQSSHLGTPGSTEPAPVRDDLVAEALRARGGTRTRTPRGSRF
jgi:site-specific DNA recombinase